MKTITTLAAAAALCCAASAASAATLLGEGKLKTAGDLTRVESNGKILEFLDWTLTVGQTLAEGLEVYGSDGFALANEKQMTALLAAFRIDYGFASGASFSLTANGNMTAEEAALLMAAVGVTAKGTLGEASFAAYTNSGAVNPFVRICISNGLCSPDGFTTDQNPLDGSLLASKTHGLALVREVAVVPLPAGLPLVLTGLAALAAARHGKRRRCPAAGDTRAT